MHTRHDEARMPSDDPPVIRTIAMPADTNPAGDIFGGWLMAQMDLAAGSVATRHARGRCATVAVKGMEFLSPVFVGDEISLFGRLVGTGRSSMRIAVEAWRRGRDAEESFPVTRAEFTFIAIDQNRRPRPLTQPTEVASIERQGSSEEVNSCDEAASQLLASPGL